MAVDHPKRRPRTRTPRTGRRPGESDTYDALLEAARRLFAERGYEGASLRAIAAAAGVDAALVAHFFGSKADLLAAAVDWPFDPDTALPRLLARGPDHVGETLSELFLGVWDDERQRSPLLTLLRAATTEPRAATLLHEFVCTRLLGPLLAQLGSDQPELRSDLVTAQLSGLALTRYILRFEPIASTPAEQLIAWIAPTLQRYLTGTL
jgi:AcrR family transcriptional regulator